VVVAALHDRNVTAYGHALGNPHAARLAGTPSLSGESDKTFHVRRAQEEIDEREATLEARGILADQATHDHEGRLRVLAFEWLEGTEASDRFVFGTLSHYAGVQEHQVGLRRPARGGPSQGVELFCDSPGVGLVHLAADGPDVVLHGNSRYKNRATSLRSRSRLV
jgi:hypothetical protein